MRCWLDCVALFVLVVCQAAHNVQGATCDATLGPAGSNQRGVFGTADCTDTSDLFGTVGYSFKSTIGTRDRWCFVPRVGSLLCNALTTSLPSYVLYWDEGGNTCTCSNPDTFQNVPPQQGTIFNDATLLLPWVVPGETFGYTCYVCLQQDGTSLVAGDPIVRGFDGTTFYYHATHGQPVAMLSSPDHAINAEIGTLMSSQGGYNDEWLLAVGLRYQDVTVTVRVVAQDDILEVYHEADAQHATQKRMRVINGTAPLEVTLNGVTITHELYSGHAIDTGNKAMILYMAPAEAVNPNDAHDGPLLSFKTPDLEVTVYLESEGCFHLDLEHTIISKAVQPGSLHGVVGQTLAWKADDMGPDVQPHSHTMLGTSEDYYLTDGLTGTRFTHSQFCWPECASKGKPAVRRRKLVAMAATMWEGLTAGTTRE